MIKELLDRAELAEGDVRRLAVVMPTEPTVMEAYEALCAEYAEGREGGEAAARLYDAVVAVAEGGGSLVANKTAYQVCEILTEIAWETAGPVEIHLDQSGFSEVYRQLLEITHACEELEELQSVAKEAAASLKTALSKTEYKKPFERMLRQAKAQTMCHRSGGNCYHQVVQRVPQSREDSLDDLEWGWWKFRDNAGVEAGRKIAAVDDFLSAKSLALRGRAGRGEELADSGEVRDVSYVRERGELRARVGGSRPLAYPVHIRGLTWHSNGRRNLPEIHGSCACPDAQEWCKHVIAALYVWAGTNGRPERYERARRKKLAEQHAKR